MRFARFAAIVMLALLLPLAAPAQTIRGRTVDAVTHAAISGALAELRSPDAAVLAQVFTSVAGTFAFPVNPGRRYQVRVVAIGYARHQVVDVTVDSGVVNLPDIVLSPIAVTLPELHAMAGRRACGASALDPATFGGLLEGARTSLQVMDATVRSRAVVFEVEQVHVIVTRRRRGSTASADTSLARLQAWPVQSLSLDSLAMIGFEREATAGEGGGDFFYGPDLLVLFSDWFLDTHCFTLDRKLSRGDTVVIRFEPAGNVGRVDLKGQLVVDRRTLSLRRMSYSHHNLLDGVPDGLAGGEMRFAQFDGGLWVPTDWAIWAPVLQVTTVVSPPPRIYAGGQSGFGSPPLVTGTITKILGREENRGWVVRVLPGGGP